MEQKKEGVNLFVPMGIFFMFFLSAIIAVLIKYAVNSLPDERVEKREVKIIFKKTIEYQTINLFGAIREVYVLSFTDRTYENVSKDDFYRLRAGDTVLIEKDRGYIKKIFLKKNK